MILIQIVLILLLLVIGINFLGSRNSSRTKAIKKLLVVMAIPSALFVIVFPSASTKVANALGVGRGADLLLYGLTMVVMFQLFDAYVKNKEDQKRITTLTRKIAILEAKLDAKIEKSKK